MMTNRDASQDGGIRINCHVVLDDWVTRHVQHVAVLIVFKALGTQRHTLIECHVITDDTRLTYYHTRSVVNRKVFADGSSRVNIDTRLRVSLFCDDTWNDGYLQFMQFVGNTIVRHGIHYRIAENHLTIVRRSGVVVEHRLHIGIKQSLDFRQCINEKRSFTLSLLVGFFLRGYFFAVLAELQSVGYLFHQQTV